MANELFAGQTEALEASLKEIHSIIDEIERVCLYDQKGELLMCSGNSFYHFIKPETVTPEKEEHSFNQLMVGDCSKGLLQGFTFRCPKRRAPKRVLIDASKTVLQLGRHHTAPKLPA